MSQSQTGPSKDIRGPKLYGCSPITRYDITEKLGEGTFGHVHKGTFKPTGTAVALKQIILHNSQDGMPITALREIKIMKSLRQRNILHLLDMAVEKKRQADGKREYSFFMIMNYMDHDLCGLLHNREIKFTLPVIKLYMQQILSGVEYLHEEQYMHRDIKSANILVNNDGTVKVADFGLARKYFEAPPTVKSTSPATRKYTPKVVTRWYRPPELLLGDNYYTTAIDIWGVGCIFGEFFKRRVLIPGDSDLDQMNRIFHLVGSPNEENMPGYDSLPVAREVMPIPQQQGTINEVFHNVPNDAKDLIAKMLALDPMRRMTAKGALQHKFFTEGLPPAALDSLPVYPSSREMDVRKKREAPSPPINDIGNKRKRRNDNRRRLRAFEAKVPNKRELKPHERIPPYKRNANPNSQVRGIPNNEIKPEAVMNKGLNY